MQRAILALAAMVVSLPALAAEPRQVYVSSYSEPGWIPSETLEEHARRYALQYLAAKDSGDGDGAYEMFADKSAVPSRRAFKTELEKFNVLAGSAYPRTIVRVTWTKDPPRAVSPAPGLYAAVDIVSRFQNIDRHCGYLVLYKHTAAGQFKVMREESNYIDNKTASALPADELKAVWATLTARCPNYSSTRPRPVQPAN